MKKLNKDSYFYEQFIENFAYTYPSAAVVKKVSKEGFLYAAANDKMMELLGIETSIDLIGRTVYDLADIMLWRWTPDFAKNTHDIDTLVLHSQKPITTPQENLINKKNGYVTAISRTKIPIFSDASPNTVKAIFSYAADITTSINAAKLLQLYHDLYKDKRTATAKYLEYIGFDFKIAQSITPRELDFMLSFLTHRNLKEIANELQITPRTAEAHLNNIKQKTGCVTTSSLMNLLVDIFYAQRTNSNL